MATRKGDILQEVPDGATRASTPLLYFWSLCATYGSLLPLDSQLCRPEKLQVLFLVGLLWLHRMFRSHLDVDSMVDLLVDRLLHVLRNERSQLEVLDWQT